MVSHIFLGQRCHDHYMNLYIKYGLCNKQKENFILGLEYFLSF